jgi:hypothetical protein
MSRWNSGSVVPKSLRPVQSASCSPCAAAEPLDAHHPAEDGHDRIRDPPLYPGELCVVGVSGARASGHHALDHREVDEQEAGRADPDDAVADDLPFQARPVGGDVAELGVPQHVGVDADEEGHCSGHRAKRAQDDQ